MGDFKRKRTEYVGSSEFEKYISEMVARIMGAHSSLSRVYLSTQEHSRYCANPGNGYPPEEAQARLKELFNAFRRGGRDVVQLSLKGLTEDQMASVAEQATKEFERLLTYVEEI